MVRALRPTDVVAYLAFRSKASTNEALLRADGACSSPTVKCFLHRALGLAPERESCWVLVERGEIAGLVTARARFGTDLWDVEQLISAGSLDVDRVRLQLLDHLSRVAAEQGIQRIFLRLRDGSDALPIARRAGFSRYTSEAIYHLPETRVITRKSESVFRPRRLADHQDLFQLYTMVVPAYVRQIEGLTLQEWRWTDGWNLQSVHLGRSIGRRDFVAYGEGRVCAWLQVNTRRRLMTILTAPHDQDILVEALDLGITLIGPGKTMICTVREYDGFTGRLLEDRGFAFTERHELLARTLAMRIPEPRLVPVRAS